MPDTIASSDPGPPTNWARWCLAGFYGFALLLVFHETFWSMVSIWLRSDSYAHGFLVLPISLWLIWEKREQLQLSNISPAPWVTVLIVPAGFAWLLAWLVNVLVVQHLALVAMLVIGVWAILGHRLTRLLVFPLFFLFFAVPMGEALVPLLMEFTASATVWLIQQTGIPVYREGMYFTLPSGAWSVVEACSGLRYLIASVTLGALFAYLTYRSFWRRFLFVLASLIVPILANALRAFIVVMLGHFSDMTIGTGKDHLVYGWVIFGIVILLMFWLGSLFREDYDAGSSSVSARAVSQGNDISSPLKLFVITVIALTVAAAWPILSYTMTSRTELANFNGGISLPAASGGWSDVATPPWNWQPDASVAGQVSAYYGLSGNTVGLFIQYSNDTQASGDVVGSSTLFADRESGGHVISLESVTVHFEGNSVVADQANLQSSGGQFLAWSWYRVGDVYTSNDYVAKLREVWVRLGFGGVGVYRLVIALPVEHSVESGQALLQDFLTEHGHQLGAALSRSTEVGL